MNNINHNRINGYNIQSNKGELIENILIRNEQVIAHSLKTHKRISVLRFELKFPTHYSEDTNCITKFFNSLRDRIKNDLRLKSIKRQKNIHSDLNYIWVNELSEKNGWHYHVAIILNHDVYNCFGKINSANANMYSRIMLSWASALGIHKDAATGLVHIPKNPIYKINVNSESYVDDCYAVFFRLSYFAKKETKPYGFWGSKRYYGTSSIGI